MKRKLLPLIALLFCILILFSGCQTLSSLNKSFTPEDSLAVHYLDVGQGDAILLVDKDDTMLIDGGNPENEPDIVKYIKSLGITQLDYVVATHNHNDHAGGLADVVANIDVSNLYITHSEETKASQNLIKAASDKNVPISIPAPGTTFSFGGSAIVFLGPLSIHENVNDDSLVFKVTRGGHRFLFTGDMERQAEQELLSQNLDLEADVLKVGHHGSSTSTGYVFLRAVNPRYSVISSGANNDYGHPHEETLSRLNDIGSTLFRTDLLGAVVATSQGDQLTFNKKGTIPTREYQVVDNGLVSIPNQEPQETSSDPVSASFIGNRNSKVYHLPTCPSLPRESNRVYLNSFEEALEQGFTPCGVCKPPS